MIKLIIAIAKNGTLGNDDQLVWRIPDELKHFKRTTEGHAIVMGRTTFLGLPKALPGRRTYVLSLDPEEFQGEDVVNVTDAKALFAKYKNSDKILFLAGGKSIYQQFYKEADELLITVLKNDYEGNVEWKELFNIMKDYKKTIVEEHDLYTVYSFKK